MSLSWYVSPAGDPSLPDGFVVSFVLSIMYAFYGENI